MIRSTGIDLLAATAVPLAALALTACASGNVTTGSTAPGTTSSGPSATVNVAADGNLGKVLVDAQGPHTVPVPGGRGDEQRMHRCLRHRLAAAAGCRYADGRHRADRFQGRHDPALRRQAAGHLQRPPAYLYQADQKLGDTNGEGITAFGGGWFVLSAAGNMVSGTGLNSAGGNGY